MRAAKFMGWGLVVLAVCLFVAPITSEAQLNTFNIGRKRTDDFRTIQEAIDSATVPPGSTLVLSPGRHKGARITKNVTIKGSFARGRLASVVNPIGPPRIAGNTKDNETLGFLITNAVTSATFQNLTFRNVGLPIYGIGATNVTVDNNTMSNVAQAITNWNGSGWEITNNKIQNLRISRNKAKLGGVCIVIGSTTGAAGDTTTNTIQLNTITGTMRAPVRVAQAVAGIALIDNSTAREVTGNTIDNNTIQLTLRPSRNASSKLFGIMMNDLANNAQNTIAGNTFHSNNLSGTGISVSDFFAAKPSFQDNTDNDFGTTAADANNVNGTPELNPVIQGAILDLKPF